MNEPKNIYQRINEVMKEVTYIQKKKSSGMQYSTISHDDVTASLHDAIVKHGIVYHPVNLNRNQEGNRTEVELTVRFANIDSPEDYIDVPVLGYGIDGQDKGPGKAVSYAVKYALLKTFGLETGDDPDNDQNVTHEPAKQPTVTANRPVLHPSPLAAEQAPLPQYEEEYGQEEEPPARPIRTPDSVYGENEIEMGVKSVSSGISKDKGTPYTRVDTTDGEVYFYGREFTGQLVSGGQYAVTLKGKSIISAREL